VLPSALRDDSVTVVNQAGEAVRLAQITGKPVQVAYTRAEEFFYEDFQPASRVEIGSGTDSGGRIVLWDYQVWGAGSRTTEVFYDVPHHTVRVYGGWMGGSGGRHPFNVGPWRAPGANTNRFAGEQQIDMMAAASGMDPIEFRLMNTSDERMVSVLEAVRDASRRESRPSPSGTATSDPPTAGTLKGRGVASGIDAETYVALAVEASVDPESGNVTVDRVVCAQDMGVVVNPDGARMQMEGCIAMGLGYVFSEELRFEGGKILDTNFATYKLARIRQTPEIETVFVPNDDLAPKGGGEPAIINMGAAVANAVFDATGARVLRLPMTPERVMEALSQA
jgi:isoquinoline 1-oxidoreductase